MTRTLLTLAALLLAATVTHAAPKLETRQRDKGKVYKTPQDCFDALVKAIEKKDFRGLIDCVTPDEQKRMAVEMAVEGVMLRDGGLGGKGEDTAKKYKPVFDVMDKYGLTKEALKEVGVKGFRATRKQREAIAKLIKDHAAFTAEFMAAQDKASEVRREQMPKLQLGDVKIDGDKATAKMIVSIQNQEEIKESIAFQKINGSWRLIPEPNRKEVDEEAPKAKK